MAAGHGIVVLPLSTAVFYTRPGVAYSHVSDIPPNQVCLAWVRRTGWVRGVAFSPDGRLLANASADKTARVWG